MLNRIITVKYVYLNSTIKSTDLSVLTFTAAQTARAVEFTKVSLPRSKMINPTCVLDMYTQLHLTMRLQSWSFVECEYLSIAITLRSTLPRSGGTC